MSNDGRNLLDTAMTWIAYILGGGTLGPPLRAVGLGAWWVTTASTVRNVRSCGAREIPCAGLQLQQHLYLCLDGMLEQLPGA